MIGYQRQRAEERVAKTRWLRLYDITQPRRPHAGAVILKNIGFTGGYDKADAGSSGADHTLDDVLAHRARPFGLSFEAAAHWQQLFRKRQRLNPGPRPCGRNDSPHSTILLAPLRGFAAGQPACSQRKTLPRICLP